MLLVSCSLWEYEDPSDPLGNQPPETYLALSAADTIYRVIDHIIADFDSVTSQTVYDTIWGYVIGDIPSDTAFIQDTLQNAFSTITTSQKLLNWWGEDRDGDVVAYDVRWNTDADWQRTYREDSLFNVPIRTLLDVFHFYVRAVDDSGAVDQSPAMLTFPIRNSQPQVEFKYGSIPLKADHGSVSYTFPTRTFTWDAFDLDGLESITSFFYALDDTCDTCWIELDARIQTSITFPDTANDVALIPGRHTFFLKARDIAGAESPVAQFPDTNNVDECQAWEVKPVVGNTLLVDDFPLDVGNEAQDWYSDVLVDLLGQDQHSIWEVGSALPYSAGDVQATLEYFDHVVWFTAYTQTETYDDASTSIYNYVLNGGNFFINVIELKDTSFVWFPLESFEVINPNGRLFPGRTIESQVTGLADLATSYTIGVRVRSFVPDTTQFDVVTDLLHMAPPGTGDEWTGTPNVCSLGQFFIPPNQQSGKVVMLSLPLHNGSRPILEGSGGSGAQLLEYLFNQEFGQ